MSCPPARYDEYDSGCERPGDIAIITPTPSTVVPVVVDLGVEAPLVAYGSLAVAGELVAEQVAVACLIAVSYWVAVDPVAASWLIGCRKSARCSLLASFAHRLVGRIAV